MTHPLLCLTAAIFFEARDQPPWGMEMVAQVVMNRVEHHKFPDTVCDVVYEPYQFSFANGGHRSVDSYDTPKDRRAARMAREVALAYLEGESIGVTSTHYHTVAVAPWWKYVFKFDGQVGDHVFYTCYKRC